MLTEEQFAKCIDLMLAGNRDGLQQVYQSYGKYIYIILYDVLKNKEDAEDVTTEFFLKLWKVADKYQEGHGHKAWMGRIAHNMAIDFIRKKKPQISYEEMVEDEEIADENFESNTVDKMVINEAVKTLKTEEQEIVNMKILLQMTFQEIADALEKPMGTVTWKYRQAMEKLRRCGL